MESSFSCKLYLSAYIYFKYMDVCDTLYMTVDIHVYIWSILYLLIYIYIYSNIVICLPKEIKMVMYVVCANYGLQNEITKQVIKMCLFKGKWKFMRLKYISLNKWK